MRVAVIGAGISGLSAAWRLAPQHEVTVFEADSRIGGHTHTHEVHVAGQDYRIDSGFIVFNHAHYPLFSSLLEELEVPSQPSDMSFAVRNDRTGMEYNASSIRGLFARPTNAIDGRFWAMLRDIFRFYREAPALLGGTDPGPTAREFLQSNRYSQAFIEDHLVPMASALWSAPPGQVLEFPSAYMVQFFTNHQMLQVSGRPQWRVVRGGSSRYVERLLARIDAQVRPGTPIARIERSKAGVCVITGSGDRFECDQVVLACHSDQALALLAHPTPVEREVLGAMTYQVNDVVLHTDVRLLPRRPRAWAAWNVLVPETGVDSAPCTVSYDMNILQGIQADETFVVTLNCTDQIDSQRVIARMSYHHPVYTAQSVAAQSRHSEISGHNRTWYCGAYWGWGFHEDGVRSALDAVTAMKRERAGA